MTITDALGFAGILMKSLHQCHGADGLPKPK
jgi:hypothetical protein